jgi:hypothetical protein
MIRSSGAYLGGRSGIYPVGVGGTPPFDFGNALQFDGVNDYVSCSNIALTTISTLSFWFNISDADRDGTIFGNSADGNTAYRILSSTQIRLGYVTASDFTVSAIVTGTWYHCLIAIGATTTRLYLNGVESTTGALANKLITINQLGKYHLTSGILQLNGLLDEVAIWNGTHEGTLTDAQNLYNSGNGALASDVIASPTVYWRMNESGTDTTAVDSSGNGNNGTLNNFSGTYWVAH